MSRSRVPFAGRLEAAGFLIDPSLVGVAEAARRVAANWVEGTRLLDLDGRWLLVFPEPISVRAERAPGLPVQAGLPRGLLIHQAGAQVEVPVETLPHVNLTALIDVESATVIWLDPAPSIPAPAPQLVHSPVAPPPAIRSAAGVGLPDPRVARRAAALAQEATEPSEPGRRGSGIAARLLARSPAGPVLRRRHLKYVDHLTASFRDRNWDEALRSAIGLGGEGKGLSMRLPKPRRGPLRPGTHRSVASGSVPYGMSLQQHLRNTYVSAAAQLEKEGKYLLAAFVHADLLDNPVAAVELLERHGDFRKAAELAEGWRLNPALVVRLWWRVGDRARAVRIATTRGAFADAVARLQRVDDDAATALRRAWMLERRAAGDHLGAVNAAWPAVPLRDETLPDIATGIAQGGRTAGTLLAHLLEHTPNPTAIETARGLLDEGAPTAESRSAFIQALAKHPAKDPAHDRELSSIALATVISGGVIAPDKQVRDLSRQLRPRADALLVADLPTISSATPDASTSLDIDATDTGQLTIYDAVAIGENSVLVALGELGVRLLTRDGRTRAQWNIPTHSLVVADHGSRALLITRRDSTFVVHQLDLPNGRPVELPPLDAMPLDSYDGSRPVLVSERGIEWVEHIDGRWQVIWREVIEPNQHVFQVARRPNAMSALFLEQEVNAWQWELPSITLRQRGTIESAQELAVLASGQIGRLHQQSGVSSLDWHSPYGHRLSTATHYPEGDVALLTAGDTFALIETRETDMRLTVHHAWDSPETAVVHIPANAEPLLRSWGDLITLGHTNGRLLVIDAERHRLLADFAVPI